MGKFLTRFLEDKRGATAIEYGLIAALIAVAIIPALLMFTDSFKSTYEYLASKLTITL